MAEDQDTQTGAAVYQEFVKYAADQQLINENYQRAHGQVQYKSFSIFQPKFHENFVKFVKNAVLVFEPVKWYLGVGSNSPRFEFFS